MFGWKCPNCTGHQVIGWDPKTDIFTCYGCSKTWPGRTNEIQLDFTTDWDVN